MACGRANAPQPPRTWALQGAACDGAPVGAAAVGATAQAGWWACWARRSTSVSLLAPATTVAACRRPGWRERRSIGPETDTAATTRPDGPADRGGDRGDAGLALADALGPAAAADAGQGGGGELGALQARGAAGRAPPRRAAPGRRSRPASTASAPTGIVSRRPDRPLGGGDADALVALAAEELGALAGEVAQGAEHRPGGGEQAVLAGRRGQLAEPRAEHEPALHVARDQPVVLERDGEPVGRGAGQSGGLRPAGPGWPGRPRGRRARWRPCRERRLR